MLPVCDQNVMQMRRMRHVEIFFMRHMTCGLLIEISLLCGKEMTYFSGNTVIQCSSQYVGKPV